MEQQSGCDQEIGGASGSRRRGKHARNQEGSAQAGNATIEPIAHLSEKSSTVRRAGLALR